MCVYVYVRVSMRVNVCVCVMIVLNQSSINHMVESKSNQMTDLGMMV